MSVVDALRAMRVVNTHDLLLRFADKDADVAVTFDGGSRDRSARVHGASVYSPTHHTDPNAAWYDHGKKTFVGPRAETMPRAIAWASERYGIAEWATDPTDRNTKVPLVVRQRALEAARKGSQP